MIRAGRSRVPYGLAGCRRPPAGSRTTASHIVSVAGWSIVVALALLTVVLRLPAFLSSRHLVFDDGTYGLSVIDMRHGLAPYSGVFSAQGPLHFSLLYLGDLLGFRTIEGPRVAPMLAGIAATIASVGDRPASRRARRPGVIAGVLVATSGSMIWTTGQVTGDGIASALAVCSRCGLRSRTATTRACGARCSPGCSWAPRSP